MLTGGHVLPQARARILALAACVGMAAGLLPSPGPAVAAFPGRNGRIVFPIPQVRNVASSAVQTTGGVNHDLFTVSASGEGLRRLTDSPETDDVGPAWSPDGRQIVFSRSDLAASPTHVRDIYVTDALGRQETNLTASPLQQDFTPSWSPDGTKIVFASARDGNYFAEDLYIMESNGENVVQVTHEAGREWWPKWSPQGDVIAYIGQTGIRIIRPDGSGSRTVGQFPVEGGLSWSPDGRRLTYSRDGDIW